MHASAAELQCRALFARDDVLLQAAAHEKTFVFGLGTAPHQLTKSEAESLSPNILEVGVNGKSLPLRVSTIPDFDRLEGELRRKGFWILFTPSPAYLGGDPVGHAYLLVDGILYSRNLKDAGPDAITTVAWKNRLKHQTLAPMIDQAPYVVAQFFETEESTVVTLGRFATARTFGQNSLVDSQSMGYKFRPLSKYADLPRVENCSTFCFSWSHADFLQAQPELMNVHEQLGQTTLNEMPNLQLTNNVQIPAYRGTILMSKNPAQTLSMLTALEGLSSPDLRQIFKGSPGHLLAVPSAAEQQRGYFILPRLYRDGSLNQIAEALPDLQKMGIDTLWLGPIHAQTSPDESPTNTHGYWPADHASVDPNLGTVNDLKKLINEAHDKGMQVCLDAVINHFGYSSSVKLNGHEVSTQDLTLFKSGSDAARLREYEILLARFDEETDVHRLIELQREISEVPLFGLPSLRHEKPEAAGYVLESYKKFVDLGVDTLRIDAAKHIEFNFLMRFMNTLTQYAETRGRRVKFIWEFVTHKSDTLNLIAREALSRLKDPSRTFFYDFPFGYEIRRLSDPEFKFSWLMGFYDHRVKSGHPLKNYVPMIENHDDFSPVKDPFITRLTYLLSDVLSLNPTFLSHGSENRLALETGRDHLEGVYAEGDFARFVKELGDVLLPYNAASALATTLYVSDDLLIIERKIPGERTLLVVVNKAKSPARGEFSWAEKNPHLIRRLAQGEASILREDIGWSYSIAAESFAAYEVEEAK